MEINNICVYCASSNKAAEVYGDTAYELGALLAKEGITVVTGAGSIGLMRKVEDGALDNGGKAIGVIAARKVQEQRFKDEHGIHCNAQMTPKLITKYAALDETSLAMLKTAMTRFDLSARAYDRILKVARTIADLDGSKDIQFQHIAEAIGYRNLDRESWGT